MLRLTRFLGSLLLFVGLLLLASCGGGGGSGSGGSSNSNTLVYDCSGLSGNDRLLCNMQNNVGGSGGSSTTVPRSSQKEITSYEFHSLPVVAVGTIDQSTHVIAVTVPRGTNVAALVATFTASYGTSINVAFTTTEGYNGFTRQYSGQTVNDFTQPVVYEVYAEDGSSTTYTVVVTVAPA